MKRSKHFPKGLTLMELLVVVMIIMIVMAIGANTYRNQRKNVIYNDSVLKTLNLIKDARNYALNSRQAYDTCQATEPEMAYPPPEGYGVYIERSDEPGETRIVLFANIKIDNASRSEIDQYDQVADSCQSDLIEEEYHLPVDSSLVGLWIDRAEPDHTPISVATPNKAVIIFRPPLADAIVAVNNNTSSVTYLDDLYLEFRRPGAPDSVPSQYIHFNRIAGFPEIDNE